MDPWSTSEKVLTGYLCDQMANLIGEKVYRAVERYWHKMLCSRSWKGNIGWMVFHQIKAQSPLLRPKMYLPYRELQAIAAL
jgi:hypothetical protein